MQHTIPALYSLFLWWFSTGIVLYLDGLPRRTFALTMAGSTLVLALSLRGLALGGADTSLWGAYVAFTWGLLAWSWVEVGFYTGFITGLPTPPCVEDCSGWRHLGHAIRASLWHELAILAVAGAVWAITRHAPNQIGLWTFVSLWGMHQSAKLNVFLGVRNLNEEFLPEHMRFLRSFLRRRPMNLLFPVSVTALTGLLVWLVAAAFAPAATPAREAGMSLIAMLVFAGLLEHWVLVLPLPFAALWRWSLNSRAPVAAFDVQIVSGFLGAGKTSFLRRLLETPPEGHAAGPTIVLVNDFGAIGVDASLLAGTAAEIVELPNGCICCSLRTDLQRQLLEIVGRHAPDRVLIEPSGIADLASLLRVLEGEVLRPMVRSLRVCAVIDGPAFLADHARAGAHLEAQVRLAPALLLNKAEALLPAEYLLVEQTLRTMNPEAVIQPGSFGQPRHGTPAQLMATGERIAGMGGADHAHAHPHAVDAWSTHLAGTWDSERLHEILLQAGNGAFGELDRVKGIARARQGWIRFDLAGGRPSLAAFAAAGHEQARVVAIGRALDRTRLADAFHACAVPV